MTNAGQTQIAKLHVLQTSVFHIKNILLKTKTKHCTLLFQSNNQYCVHSYYECSPSDQINKNRNANNYTLRLNSLVYFNWLVFWFLTWSHLYNLNFWQPGVTPCSKKCYIQVYLELTHFHDTNVFFSTLLFFYKTDKALTFLDTFKMMSDIQITPD